MREYVKPHSISVGYNRLGQSFFDLLNDEKYIDFIHSYFFSLTQGMRGDVFNKDDVLSNLFKCDTYGIPANLLLNDEVAYRNVDSLMADAMKVCNLQAITILEPNVAPYVKEKYPDIEIHLSVRFFDWHSWKTPIELLNAYYDIITKYIDVVNISGRISYNDHMLFDILKYHNIKTKMIVNEGCIIRRSDNFKRFPGYEDSNCFNGACTQICEKVISDNPWLELATINIYKETLGFFDYDILKISSRSIDNNAIKPMLDYWCNNIITKRLILSSKNIIELEDKYDIFLQWIETKASCCCDCFNCRKCEKYYKDLTK